MAAARAPLLSEWLLALAGHNQLACYWQAAQHLMTEYELESCFPRLCVLGNEERAERRTAARARAVNAAPQPRPPFLSCAEREA